MAEFRHTKSLNLIIDIDYLRLLRAPVFAAQRQQVIDAMRRAAWTVNLGIDLGIIVI